MRISCLDRISKKFFLVEPYIASRMLGPQFGAMKVDLAKIVLISEKNLHHPWTLQAGSNVI